jgi:hypothetical protein
MVYRPEGCPYCGGEPFHHLDCPFVRLALIIASIVLGLVVGAYTLVQGRLSGPIIIFFVYLILLVGWLVASRRAGDRRDRRR